MEKLAEEYKLRLEAIANEVQASEILKTYLEEEGEEEYRGLIDAYEPEIDAVYREVADLHPMQLIDLENYLLADEYEGLYLPKLIGYSVLRGVVNEKCKYIQSQQQFQNVLLFMCKSPDFEMIAQRVGQGIQVGFALSSDIWITNLIERIDSKRAASYLRRQKKKEYLDLYNRKKLYEKYKRQFASLNFYTATFPSSHAELNLHYPQLRDFFVERILRELDNSSLKPFIKEFVANDDLPGSLNFVYLFGLIINYFRFEDKMKNLYAERFNTQRRKIDQFNKKYFTFQRELLDSRLKVYPECDQYVSSLIDKSIDDDLTMYYNLTDTIHGKGYVHEETQEEIMEFYYEHDGLSTINECIRLTILKYFRKVLENLEAEDFQDYFEINKTFSVYMNIFQNEKFNQAVKDISLHYIKKKLFLTFTNKRAKEYQDIKKFITATFTEHDLMDKKQLKELFKTKRKKRAES